MRKISNAVKHGESVEQFARPSYFYFSTNAHTAMNRVCSGIVAILFTEPDPDPSLLFVSLNDHRYPIDHSPLRKLVRIYVMFRVMFR